MPCTYDLEVAASRYLDALADGEVPLEFLFSGSVFYAARTAGCRPRASLGAGGRVPPAGRGVARDDGAPLPRHRVAAAAQGRLRRLWPTSRGGRCHWDDASTSCCRGRGGPRSAAIADAVLYEGYMLWPYRRSALKNQRRWTFGGVLSARAQRGAPGRPRGDADRVPGRRDGPPDVEVRVRFLHVVRRDVARDATAARAVDELRSAASATWRGTRRSSARSARPAAVSDRGRRSRRSRCSTPTGAARAR